MTSSDALFGLLLFATAAAGELATIILARTHELAWELRYILAVLATMLSAGLAGAASGYLWSDEATGVIVGLLSGLTLFPVLARMPPPT